MRPEPDPRPGRGPERTPAGISVILITLNEENNIRACLESLLHLDYPEERREILVVDASQDNTPEIVKRYPQVRCLRASKGFSRQRNAGLQAAGFGLVAFTDADCRVPPDWLRVIDRAFKREDLAGIGGNALLPPGSGYFDSCAAAIGHPAGGSLGFGANVSRGPEGVEFVAGCNFAFRREALLSVGGFNPEFEDGGEEVDLSRRLKSRGFLIDYEPDLTVFHNPHSPLGPYIRWNIRVGFSKFNLKRPGLLRLLLEPAFVAWPALGLLAVLGITVFRPWLGLGLLAMGWLGYLGVLFMATRPYPLLLRRRRSLGLGLFSVMATVPLLILVRQVCLNWGQLHKWFRVLFSAKGGA
jgi:GT2 family glycosyltransferase